MIRYDEVERLLLQQPEGCRRRMRLRDSMAEILEHCRGIQKDQRIVIHCQNPQRRRLNGFLGKNIRPAREFRARGCDRQP
ncbi:hypothetical protein A4R29_31515 (plasmid) [Mesorhizobium ciceri biovar biserrulae]|nr:hypothetical protein A4R29_31515 [Mesorhizobium ciceri biovar biserrulae]